MRSKGQVQMLGQSAGAKETWVRSQNASVWWMSLANSPESSRRWSSRQRNVPAWTCDSHLSLNLPPSTYLYSLDLTFALCLLAFDLRSRDQLSNHVGQNASVAERDELFGRVDAHGNGEVV